VKYELYPTITHTVASLLGRMTQNFRIKNVDPDDPESYPDVLDVVANGGPLQLYTFNSIQARVAGDLNPQTRVDGNLRIAINNYGFTEISLQGQNGEEIAAKIQQKIRAQALGRACFALFECVYYRNPSNWNEGRYYLISGTGGSQSYIGIAGYGIASALGLASKDSNQTGQRPGSGDVADNCNVTANEIVTKIMSQTHTGFYVQRADSQAGTSVITDDGGSWTGGYLVVTINGTDYTQVFLNDKDFSLTNLSYVIAMITGVSSSVYDPALHKIVITPVQGFSFYTTVNYSNIIGTMTMEVGASNLLKFTSTDSTSASRLQLGGSLAAKIGFDSVNYESYPASESVSTSSSSLGNVIDQEIMSPAQYTIGRGFDPSKGDVIIEYCVIDDTKTSQRRSIITTRQSQFSQRTTEINARVAQITPVLTQAFYDLRKPKVTTRLNKKTGSYAKIGAKLNQSDNNQSVVASNDQLINDINSILP
jgi:hypothetical protein